MNCPGRYRSSLIPESRAAVGSPHRSRVLFGEEGTSATSTSSYRKTSNRKERHFSLRIKHCLLRSNINVYFFLREFLFLTILPSEFQI